MTEKKILSEDLINSLIKAGAKIWEKGDNKRLYLNNANNNAQLKIIGAKIVDRASYLCEHTGFSSKSKVYYDLNANLFICDTGVNNSIMQELGFKSARA
jgi:hypothetical protein